MKEGEEKAWWKGKTDVIQPGDQQLAVVAPRSDVTNEERVELGRLLVHWQEPHAWVRHIWGLDDLLEGQPPRTPPIYLAVPYATERFEERYEPVALVFVTQQADRTQAIESLGQALETFRERLAWFDAPDAYSQYQR